MKVPEMPTKTTHRSPLQQRLDSNRRDSIPMARADYPMETKTQGEVEAQVSDAIRRYSLEYIGRGPHDVHAHLIGDLLVVRMSGVLTVAEQHLAARSGDKGRVLVKQIRGRLIELARPDLVAAIRICTLCDVISMHHDISTITGEEIIVFTLDGCPTTRPCKRK